MYISNQNFKNKYYELGKTQCFYCGISLTKKSACVDHLVPKSKGGPQKTYNLVFSCSKCNCKKGSSSLPDFINRIKNKAAGLRTELEYHNNILKNFQ